MTDDVRVGQKFRNPNLFSIFPREFIRNDSFRNFSRSGENFKMATNLREITRQSENLN